MLVIKVWCLPTQKEEELRELHKAIVAAVVETNLIEVKNQNDMVVLFPSDLMKYGLGEEIIVEIGGLQRREGFSMSECLAERVGKAIQSSYPKARVECFINNFNMCSWNSSKYTCP